MSRQKARESLFLLVFERISNGETNALTLEHYSKALAQQQEYIKTVYEGVDTHYLFMQRHIAKLSKGFSFERIYKVDLSLLAVAFYEILFVEDVPDLVAVSESLELAKRYSSEKSAKFIHGILSNVIKDKERLLHLFAHPEEDVDVVQKAEVVEEVDATEKKEASVENADIENIDAVEAEVRA